MVSFVDGPALGNGLVLTRVPYYLRVVYSDARGWGALEFPDDSPCPDESVHLYYFVKDTGVVHIDYRDRITGIRSGKTVRSADYKVHPHQPAQATLRDYEQFHAWCMDHLPESMNTPEAQET